MTTGLSWTDLKTYLEHKQAEVQAEIEQYPAPIPACDQQFNYLLEQRGLLRQELYRVVDLNEANASVHALNEFVTRSPLLQLEDVERFANDQR